MIPAIALLGGFLPFFVIIYAIFKALYRFKIHHLHVKIDSLPESFEKLRDWYPFSKYAKLAELKIADAHYHLGEYDEAIMAYEEFEELHPKNEAIPYVIYQIGLCHYEQLDTVDRDQTSAKLAIATFNRLFKAYPDDPYNNKAQELYRLSLKSLAEHDLYVGLFYYKTKHYEAALQRFQAVVQHYPDVGAHQTALKYIAACETMLAEKEAE